MSRDEKLAKAQEYERRLTRVQEEIKRIAQGCEDKVHAVAAKWLLDEAHERIQRARNILNIGVKQAQDNPPPPVK